MRKKTKCCKAWHRNCGCVAVHTCAASKAYFKQAVLAREEDYHREYLALEITVKQVDDLDDAIRHIEQYGSRHTEVICSENQAHAERFLREVNAAGVMANASSRFSDGGELGLGAEIGISTTKLHAYSPMGLEALTTEKFIVTGAGQVRT